jgi:hypothetical protein
VTPWRRWLVGGLAIAAADVMLFSSFWWPRGVSPDRIFRGISVGLFGHDARDGGVATTIAGAILHVINATLFVTIYGLVARRVPALARHPLVFGPPYGLLVWAGMTFVVIPLSRIGWHGVGDNTAWLVASLLFHASVVGIGAAWFSRERRATMRA